MDGFRDPAYLKTEQYKDASNLTTRVDLHARFSTNPYGWHRWLFDHLQSLPSHRHVFELGCGAGLLWTTNATRIPSDWSIALSDFSDGMLADARRALANSRHGFTFLLADAQHVPVADGSMDCVIANHMLYHVPERRRALEEIARILSPDGCLFAATVGESHLIEIDIRLRDAGIPAEYRGAAASQTFTLENGASQLHDAFSEVGLYRYVDALRVTDVEPLLAYVRSMTAATILTADALQRIRRDFEAHLAAHGEIRISKDTGLFIARGKRG